MDNGTRIVITGPPKSGKTCLLTKLVSPQLPFRQVYKPHQGMRLCSRIQIINRNMYIVEMMGIYTGDSQRLVIRKGDRSIDSALLVYSINDRSSFQALTHLYQELQWQIDGPIIIIGNKSDDPNREVTLEQGMRFARQRNCLFFEISVKESEHLDSLLLMVIYLKFSALRQDVKLLDEGDKLPKGFIQSWTNLQQLKKERDAPKLSLNQIAPLAIFIGAVILMILQIL